MSLHLEEGVTALLGVNGAGKSTLMSVAAGSLRPDAGSVAVSTNDLYARGTRNAALRLVSLMPQDPELPKRLTVRDVVVYLGWLKGMSARDARARGEHVLESVDLADKSGHRVSALSGGMLRRLALAQALVSDPEVLLLDEPSTGLDPAQRRNMIDLLGELRGSVLLSSHVVEDVEALARRTVVLHEGRILFDGSTAELARRGGERADRPLEAGFLATIAGASAR